MEMNRNISRRTFVSAAAVAGVSAAAFGLVGCAGGAISSSSAASDSSTSASADATYKIRLGAQAASGQVNQFVAEAQGYNKEEGVEVEMVYLSNLSDAASALTAGQVDVLSTYGTGGPLIQIANGQDFDIFAGYMIIGETPVFGKPETQWSSLDDFKGKKIGITRGGTPDIVLKGILYDAGIPFVYDGSTYVPEDGKDSADLVTFLEYKKNPDVLQAIANGEVDFGATATGHQIQARDLGLEVKMWPDEYWENHSCCRMFGMTDWVKENEEALYRLMRSYIRAEKYMQDHMQEVADLVVKNLDLTQETAESFVMSPHMKYDVDPYTDSVQKMWDKMEKFGYLDRGNVNLADHLNSSIYRTALESLIEENPDDKFYQDKQAEFEKNNTVESA